MVMHNEEIGYGVTSVSSQAEVVPDPQPRRGPPNATGDSLSSREARGGASRATGKITTMRKSLKIMQSICVLFPSTTAETFIPGMKGHVGSTLNVPQCDEDQERSCEGEVYHTKVPLTLDDHWMAYRLECEKGLRIQSLSFILNLERAFKST